MEENMNITVEEAKTDLPAEVSGNDDSGSKKGHGGLIVLAVGAVAVGAVAAKKLIQKHKAKKDLEEWEEKNGSKQELAKSSTEEIDVFEED